MIKITDAVGNRQGFTLVELMIVVAIIGILAAIAIPNFLQFRLKAKTAEAKSNLGNIRIAELAYFSEWDHYVSGQPQTPVNGRAGNDTKVLWDYNTRFSLIGFAADNAVYFSYSLESAAGTPLVTHAQGLTMSALGDLDTDGSVVTFWINETWIDARKVGAGF